MPGIRSERFKREVRRRRVQLAWIMADGLVNHECRLTNLSRSGAELVVEVSSLLPSRFKLRLIPHSAETKDCEVVWRRGKTLGVRFVE